MKITEIIVRERTVELKAPFVVAFATFTTLPVMLIRITTDTGLVGYGEVNPVELVNGETIATETATLPLLRDALVGTDPLAIEAAHARMDTAILGHTALKAGLDIALYDLLGKQAQLPLWRLLGGTASTIDTDITISLGPVAQMVAEAQQYVAAGFTQLKVKTGTTDAQDRAAVAGILAAVPPTVEVKLDANQAWSAKEAIAFMTSFNQPNLTILEQPLPAANHRDNPLVRAGITQTLMLDERVHDASDAAEALAGGEADAINIKLMKSSGLFGAEAINRVAEAAHVPCMIGCMAETKLGITAAAHFAAAHANVRWADLDSNLLLKDTPWLQGGFTVAGPTYQLSDAPGLGITIDEEVFA